MAGTSYQKTIRGWKGLFFIFNSSRKTHTKLGSATMARGRGGGPGTEEAGRPLLPRHKSLPAAENAGRKGDSRELDEEEARLSRTAHT